MATIGNFTLPLAITGELAFLGSPLGLPNLTATGLSGQCDSFLEQNPQAVEEFLRTLRPQPSFSPAQLFAELPNLRMSPVITSDTPQILAASAISSSAAKTLLDFDVENLSVEILLWAQHAVEGDQLSFRAGTLTATLGEDGKILITANRGNFLSEDQLEAVRKTLHNALNPIKNALDPAIKNDAIEWSTALAGLKYLDQKPILKKVVLIYLLSHITAKPDLPNNLDDSQLEIIIGLAQTELLQHPGFGRKEGERLLSLLRGLVAANKRLVNLLTEILIDYDQKTKTIMAGLKKSPSVELSALVGDPAVYDLVCDRQYTEMTLDLLRNLIRASVILNQHNPRAALRSLLKTENSWLPAEAFVYLSRIGSRGDEDIFLQDLKDLDDYTPMQPLEALGRLRSPSLAPVFEAYLQHRDRSVAAVAAKSLWSLGGEFAETGYRYLIKLVEEPSFLNNYSVSSDTLRDATLRALAEIGNHDAFSVLSRVYEDLLDQILHSLVAQAVEGEPYLTRFDDQETQSLLLSAMASLAREEDVETLLSYRPNDDANPEGQISWQAYISSLSRCRLPQVVSYLCGLLTRPELVLSVSQALARIGDPSSIPALRSASENPHISASERITIHEALVAMGDPDMTPADQQLYLAGDWNGDHERLLIGHIQAIAKRAGPSVRPTLEGMLRRLDNDTLIGFPTRGIGLLDPQERARQRANQVNRVRKTLLHALIDLLGRE